MSAIQNYLSRAQEFSSNVTDEEKLNVAQQEAKETAFGNIQDAKDRVEELKGGAVQSVGGLGLGAAGALEKGFTYAKHINDKAAKIKDTVSSMNKSLGDPTGLGAKFDALSERMTNMVSPNSALGNHIANIKSVITPNKPFVHTAQTSKEGDAYGDEAKGIYDRMNDTGKAAFEDAVNKIADPVVKQGAETFTDPAITSQHLGIAKSLAEDPANLDPGSSAIGGVADAQRVVSTPGGGGAAAAAPPPKVDLTQQGGQGSVDKQLQDNTQDVSDADKAKAAALKAQQDAEAENLKLKTKEGGGEEEGEGNDVKGLAEEGGEEAAGEGLLGALGPIGDVLAAGSAIYGLVQGKITEAKEKATTLNLTNYYNDLGQQKAPSLQTFGASVLDGTTAQSMSENF